MILKYVAHSKKVIGLAMNEGWLPGARYTNLRDVKTFDFRHKGFLDIDWKNYSFQKHLENAEQENPRITIARDVECIFQLETILREAEELLKHSEFVCIVPKDTNLNNRISELIPKQFLLAYSVPTKYGGTDVSTDSFDRPVHLLGGRPDVQRQLAEKLNVFSLDCNRFTLDARYGDFFDGEKFKKHPIGGYENCLKDSIKNITKLWDDYEINDDSQKLIGVAV